MTAYNRSDLRTMIREDGDYQNVRRFPDAYLNVRIQRAFGAFWEAIADTHQGWWDTEGDIATVASQQYIALPSDCWRVQGIDLIESGEKYPLAQIGLSDRHRYGSSTGKPSAYRTSSRGIELYQTPDAIYTLRVNYTPLAPALSDGSSREWYNGWEEFVVEHVKYQIAKRERMPLKDHLESLGEILGRITRGAGERRSQEPEYLKLREYDSLDLYDDGVI